MRPTLDKNRINTSQNSLLKELKASLKSHARSATFACGGSIAIKQTYTDVPLFCSPPVQVRYGSNGLEGTLNIPGSEPSSRGFKGLLTAAQPATFGRAGEDVLDEDYRKAGKLDCENFTTNFCPYTTGIVDTLTQMLLPQLKAHKHDRSIQAELYKLNIYSAPSGEFKSHVDTPRGAAQIGSLVVSLPTDHGGGQLAVRSAGKEVVFDWSKSANGADTEPCIKWAAFYSDCEYEVLQVTSGHRITLTYNLYVVRGLGHLAGWSDALDPTTLPLYKTLQAALKEPDFFRKGRVLAIYLTHAYAHTSKHSNFLPASLKGAGMSLYETALALGLRSLVAPVVWLGGVGSVRAGKCYYKRWDLFDPAGFKPFTTGEKYGDEESVPSDWGLPIPIGNYTWVNGVMDSWEAKKDSKKKEKMEEPQMADLVYGNECQFVIKYSRAAMLIRIPPFRQRDLPVDESKDFWDGIKRSDESDSEGEGGGEGVEKGGRDEENGTDH